MEMLKGRTETTKYLESEFHKLKKNSETQNMIVDWLEEQFDFKRDQAALMVSDYFRRQGQGYSDDMVARLILYFDFLNETDHAHEFYKDSDINRIKREKMPKEGDSIKIDPIKCIKVADDQFIGAIPNAATFFKELRSKGLIRYNPDAQRPLSVSKRKDGSIYHITLSRKAVASIRRTLSEGDYVSNTITLNIDPNEDTEFYYDEEKSELTFKGLYYFDITDGFHRYKALCQEKDKNPNFDYPMEIRITRFDREKAAYFIWQEDQKVPMNKKAAQTLNTKSTEMKVYEYIVGRREYLSNKISKEDDNLIKLSDFIACLSAVFKFDDFKNINDKYTFKSKAEMITTAGRDINQTFNILYEDYIKEGKEIWGKHLNEMELFILLSLIKFEQPPSYIYEHWEKICAVVSAAGKYDPRGNRIKYTLWENAINLYCFNNLS